MTTPYALGVRLRLDPFIIALLAIVGITASSVAVIVLPLMLFHQLQLIVSAWIAGRIAVRRRADHRSRTRMQTAEGQRLQ